MLFKPPPINSSHDFTSNSCIFAALLSIHSDNRGNSVIFSRSGMLIYNCKPMQKSGWKISYFHKITSKLILKDRSKHAHSII